VRDERAIRGAAQIRLGDADENAVAPAAVSDASNRRRETAPLRIVTAIGPPPPLSRTESVILTETQQCDDGDVTKKSAGLGAGPR